MSTHQGRFEITSLCEGCLSKMYQELNLAQGPHSMANLPWRSELIVAPVHRLRLGEKLLPCEHAPIQSPSLRRS